MRVTHLWSQFESASLAAAGVVRSHTRRYKCENSQTSLAASKKKLVVDRPYGTVGIRGI